MKGTVWNTGITRWVSEIWTRNDSNIHETPNVVTYANMYVINDNIS